VVAACRSASGSGSGGDVLGSWAEKLGGHASRRARGVLRFAFYGRVSTEDWQDPVTSRARQLQQALMLTAGVGVITAEFFDTGESRELPWARRPQAAALVAQLADPERGWDAIVIGEYERAFYGNQYASMAPFVSLLSHHGSAAPSSRPGRACRTPRWCSGARPCLSRRRRRQG
jgi:site-specific DNA recombinase